MYDDDCPDDVCVDCGKTYDIEFVDLPYMRYKSHCACTQEADEEEKRRERYNFRNGCEDTAYKQPTIGDILRDRMRKES